MKSQLDCGKQLELPTNSFAGSSIRLKEVTI